MIVSLSNRDYKLNFKTWKTKRGVYELKFKKLKTKRLSNGDKISNMID